MPKLHVDVTYKVEVDTDRDGSYPNYIQEIEDANEKAVAMVSFDFEEGSLDEELNSEDFQYSIDIAADNATHS